MPLAIDQRQYLQAIIAEIGRRDRLKSLVARAGFEKDSATWILRSDVHAAVAAALDVAMSSKLGAEIRAVLVEDGWRSRKYQGMWQWRARRIL